MCFMEGKKLIKEITKGVIGNSIDLVLFYVYFTGESIGRYGPQGVTRAFREAEKELEQCNHHTLASAWRQLRQKKFITYEKRKNLYHAEITAIGRKRLRSILPSYQTKRPWDNKIYLITYDIPERSHSKRTIFRSFLKRLGCKMLQESTWMTVYNPRELINEYVTGYKIPGTILVSDIGTDGGIGETTVKDLIFQVYELEKLNERYKEFITLVKQENAQNFLLWKYLSILKNDPQLPFELLPVDWLGEKAYFVYSTIRLDR